MRWIAVCLLCVVLSAASVSAVPIVLGTVHDAADGATANGRVVTVWIIDDAGVVFLLKTIVGSEGPSGSANAYLFDCAQSPTPCALGNTLYLKIFDNGDGYETCQVAAFIDGSGIVIAPDMTLQVISRTTGDDPVSIC